MNSSATLTGCDDIIKRLRERNAPIDRLEAADLIDSMAQRVPLTDDEMASVVKYAEDKTMAGRAVEEWHGIGSDK